MGFSQYLFSTNLAASRYNAPDQPNTYPVFMQFSWSALKMARLEFVYTSRLVKTADLIDVEQNKSVVSVNEAQEPKSEKICATIRSSLTDLQGTV